MNISITGKGLPLHRLPAVFRNSMTATGNGHQSQKSLQTSTANHSAQTTVCLKQKAPGSNVVATLTGHKITNGLTRPYKKQAGRLVGQPLQATRTKPESSDSSCTNTTSGLIRFLLDKLPAKPGQPSKTRVVSQSVPPVCDTTTSNSVRRSKSRGLTQRTVKALKTVWRASLKADDRGETFWHHLGSSLAFVAFLCGMLWILGTTPQNHERPSHDVTVQSGE